MMSSTLKGNLKALPWKLHSSTRMNFMRISWDSVIIFFNAEGGTHITGFKIRIYNRH